MYYVQQLTWIISFKLSHKFHKLMMQVHYYLYFARALKDFITCLCIHSKQPESGACVHCAATKNFVHYLFYYLFLSSFIIQYFSFLIHFKKTKECLIQRTSNLIQVYIYIIYICIYVYIHIYTLLHMLKILSFLVTR